MINGINQLDLLKTDKQLGWNKDGYRWRQNGLSYYDGTSLSLSSSQSIGTIVTAAGLSKFFFSISLYFLFFLLLNNHSTRSLLPPAYELISIYICRWALLLIIFYRVFVTVSLRMSPVEVVERKLSHFDNGLKWCRLLNTTEHKMDDSCMYSSYFAMSRTSPNSPKLIHPFSKINIPFLLSKIKKNTQKTFNILRMTMTTKATQAKKAEKEEKASWQNEQKKILHCPHKKLQVQIC